MHSPNIAILAQEMDVRFFAKSDAKRNRPSSAYEQSQIDSEAQRPLSTEQIILHEKSRRESLLRQVGRLIT